MDEWFFVLEWHKTPNLLTLKLQNWQVTYIALILCYFIQVELKKSRTDRSRKNPTIFERKSLLVPPMSQTCILNPSFWTDLILNPCKRTSSALAYWYRPFSKTAMQSNTWVGVMCWMSSLAMNFKIVVFPALSKPRKRIFSSLLLLDFSFFSSESKPCKTHF